MKVKVFNLLTDCIERGIDAGYRRAHKHTDTPSENDIKWQIDAAIHDALGDYFDFSDDLPND